MDDVLQSLEWRSVGPHRGGRVLAVTGDPVNPTTFYFGAAGGGVWKSMDAGQYWENISDGFFRRASVGAMAVAPADPNVLYVGMGESTMRNNISHGDGVYRSTDAGRTWTHRGLAPTRHIGRVRVHPTDPDLVYVAALGHAHGPNAERGIYRSKDGGANWERILWRSDETGANEVVIDPTNPRILYAAFWQVRRGPHYLSSGGPQSGIFRSTDGGDTWVELTRQPGLPTGLLGKIEIAVAPKPGRLWAIIQAAESGIFRSDDAGETWELLNADTNLTGRPWYFNHIRADPRDAETLWVVTYGLWKSTDGGRNYTQYSTPHLDHHDLWIDPRETQRMILGHDGGACVSLNGGESWSSTFNQPTAEFYHVAVDTHFPYRLYGAQQDNTTLSLPNRSLHDAITENEWCEVGGSESGYIAVRPDNPDVVYAGATQGYLTRFDRRTGQLRDITVWPEAYRGSAAKDLRYRFNWTFPIVLSPHDPNILLVGANHIFRSTDEGASWEKISPDLSRNDPATLQPSGGPITKDNVGAEVYATVFAIAFSPVKPGVIWAGTDDGLIHLSTDDGEHWHNVTPPTLPDWSLVSIIEASPFDAGTAYVAATNYKQDDFRPYLYKTTDFGETWTLITEGIPADHFTRVVRADPERPGLLYAGTEVGIYVSFDDGEAWQRLGGNLPVVPVHDLQVANDDLVVCTHGRSFWILDDLSPIRQMDRALLDRPAHLFTPRATYRFGRRSRAVSRTLLRGKNYIPSNGITRTLVARRTPDGTQRLTYLDAGDNPPDGVILHYLLREEAAEAIHLTILDADERPIRRFSGTRGAGQGDENRLPASAGLNRFVWNLRYPQSTRISTPGGDQANVAGPAAVPGTYHARLQVGEVVQTVDFTVLPDPRLTVTPAELREQFEMAIAIRDKATETNGAIDEIRSMRGQVVALATLIAETAPRADVAATAASLRAALDAIEGQLMQVNVRSPKDSLNYPVMLNAKLARVGTAVSNSDLPQIRQGAADAPPTRQARDAFRDVSARINAELDRLAAIRERDFPQFRAMVRSALADSLA